MTIIRIIPPSLLLQILLYPICPYNLVQSSTLSPTPKTSSPGNAKIDSCKLSCHLLIVGLAGFISLIIILFYLFIRRYRNSKRKKAQKENTQVKAEMEGTDILREAQFDDVVDVEQPPNSQKTMTTNHTLLAAEQPSFIVTTEEEHVNNDVREGV